MEDGLRITWIGMAINLLLGLGKVVAGWYLSSKALMADGLHSLIDLLTDVAVIFGLIMARRPEDANHHYGHHKFVSLSKLFIGGALVVFAGGLLVTVLIDLRTGRGAPKAEGAFLVACLSLLAKEGLFWWTRAVARRLKSDLLMANAWHHRMDSISSLGVAVALVAVWIGGADWAFLDGAVTLVLGFYLLLEAFKIFRRACDDLLDAAPEQEIIEDFREHILQVPGALAYHDFRVRRVGDVYEVDLHLQVEPELTVERGHAIAREVKQQMLEMHPEVSKVLIHVEPANDEHIKQSGIFDVENSPPGAIVD
ncbi:cation diffusion facilitator family transporter [Coraliomargarita parva]|uniref:cation diffusion facilitator family transporter n=1 Tax=Coraliomargarita parva TaxID=3014050 RepID=UPI0022B5D856|nr:cation diffusion facilitator family transporter [Coraliomargarita parva]